MIVLLGTDGESTRIIYHHLSRNFEGVSVILEEPVSRGVLLKKRLRKIGAARVLSQILFLAAVRPALERLYKNRIKEIIRTHDLDVRPIPGEVVTNVRSANAPECCELLDNMGPRVVVVNGTRILSKGLLESTSASFINTHTGITPTYRGVHGGYWALYEGNPAQCGVTVHIVDTGVDTGNVIAQATIQPTARDGFPTYPYLQTAAALNLLTSAVSDALHGKLASQPSTGRSALWYHPGIVQYAVGLLRGVR